MSAVFDGLRVIEISQGRVDRSSSSLFGFDQLFEVHLEFEIVATGSLDECRAVLCALFQSGLEQRFQTLPEFRGHVSLGDNSWRSHARAHGIRRPMR